MSEGTVNSRIVDSVASVVTLTGASAPAQAFAMLDTVMIETLGMAMYNAVSRQQGASMIGSAAVTAACAKMLGTPFGIAEPPPPPAPEPVHSGVHPLPPVPRSPAEIIAEASADAAEAVARMRDEEASAERNAADVQAAMAKLAAQARAGVTPPPVAPAAPAGPAPVAAAADVPPRAAPSPGEAVATATTTTVTFTSQTVPVNLADLATELPVPPALR